MFTKVEQEAIILNAVWEMIDGMVNYGMFVKYDRIENTNLMFETSAHMRLFNILLVDFLSLPQRRGKNPLPFGLPDPPNGACPSNRTFLFYLRQICDDPKLNRDAILIHDPLEAFAVWLEDYAFVENVWLPAIDTQLDMRIMRIEYLKICGDIGKHSFARLEVNVRRICRILADHGCPVDEGMGYTVLPEFYEWFHTNVFAYQASVIAEFLNNLRWGIYNYLRPEFERSFERVDPAPMYRFKYPSGVAEPLAQQMYWGLINMARSKPYFPRVTVSESFKTRY
jgi:hypothetical protein